MSENNIVRQRQGGYTEENSFSTKDEDDIKKEIPIKRQGKEEDHLSKNTLLILTMLSFITRFWNINYPTQVVFDEVHFGKFASYYLKRAYFFDVHPPLAKLMIAAMGWLLNFDGHFEFDNIGDDYIKNNVPYIGLRGLPATLGALLVPLTYIILIESGYPVVTATFAAGLVLFDNALICQTRLILLDSMLVFFMLCTFYSYIRFYKLHLREYSSEWWLWMITTGFFLGLTLSVKMVGLFTVFTIGFAVLVDLWELLDIRRGLTMTKFKKHFFARVVGLIIIPISVYLFWFYVHFAILNTSGTGDNFMSLAFQDTLHGNLMSTQSFDIKYNDTITIKHKDTLVFLHSHTEHYPLRYDDGRVSSQGQQVTGFPHNDTNNHWRIKTPGILFNSSRPENDTIKHGDFIILEHVSTQSHLLTHDVASPLMPTNQEFTTIEPDNTARFNDTLFQVFTKDGDVGSVLKTKATLFRLVHFNTKVALWTHESKLPEWAFGQQEVNGNKKNTDKSNYWFAEEIIGLNVTILKEPKKPTKQLSFLRKFFELQSLMISHNAGLTKPHPYSSNPINWPFLIDGISFWTNNDTREQIYLIGNPFGWWVTIGLMSVLVGVLAADLLSRRRGINPIPGPVRNRLYKSGGFFFIAWIFHYFPFFLMGRSLFLHHYLPALLCSYLVSGVVFNFIFVESINYPISISISPRSKYVHVLSAKVDFYAIAIVALILIFNACIFIYLAPITYGTPGLDTNGIYYRRLLDTWELHFQQKKDNASSSN